MVFRSIILRKFSLFDFTTQSTSVHYFTKIFDTLNYSLIADRFLIWGLINVQSKAYSISLLIARVHTKSTAIITPVNNLLGTFGKAFKEELDRIATASSSIRALRKTKSSKSAGRNKQENVRSKRKLHHVLVQMSFPRHAMGRSSGDGIQKRLKSFASVTT